MKLWLSWVKFGSNHKGASVVVGGGGISLLKDCQCSIGSLITFKFKSKERLENVLRLIINELRPDKWE